MTFDIVDGRPAACLNLETGQLFRHFIAERGYSALIVFFPKQHYESIVPEKSGITKY